MNVNIDTSTNRDTSVNYKLFHQIIYLKKTKTKQVTSPFICLNIVQDNKMS